MRLITDQSTSRRIAAAFVAVAAFSLVTIRPAVGQEPVTVESRLSLAGISIGDEAAKVSARLGNPQNHACQSNCTIDTWTYLLDKGSAQLTVGFVRGRVTHLWALMKKGPTSAATDSFGISIGDVREEIARWRGAANQENAGGVIYRTGSSVTWSYGVSNGRVIFIDVSAGAMSGSSGWLSGQIPMFIDGGHDGLTPDRPILVGGSMPQPWVDVYFAGTKCDGAGVWLTLEYQPNVDGNLPEVHVHGRCSTSGRERDFYFQASNLLMMHTVQSSETEATP